MLNKIKKYFKKTFRRFHTPSLSRLEKKTSPILKNEKVFALTYSKLSLALMPYRRPAKKWKRRTFKFATLLILAVTTGSVLGGWYSDRINSAKIDYSKYTVSDFAYSDAEINEIFSLATGIDNPSEEDKLNFVELAHKNGITPMDLTPSQNYVLAFYKGSKASSYRVCGSGEVSNPLKPQSVYSRWLFDGESYVFQNISVGVLSLAKCAIMKNNIVTLIDGQNLRVDGADWTGERKNYTKSEYQDLAGVTPDQLGPYIVSNKTVLDDTTPPTFVDGLYSIDFKFDVVGGVLNYAKQIQMTSGLGSAPKFSESQMTLVIDEDWTIKSCTTNDVYTIIYGIPVTVTSKIRFDYEFNVSIDETEMPV